MLPQRPAVEKLVDVTQVHQVVRKVRLNPAANEPALCYLAHPRTPSRALFCRESDLNDRDVDCGALRITEVLQRPLRVERFWLAREGECALHHDDSRHKGCVQPNAVAQHVSLVVEHDNVDPAFSSGRGRDGSGRGRGLCGRAGGGGGVAHSQHGSVVK
eukprot:2427259-Prymnesium_polylepis.1